MKNYQNVLKILNLNGADIYTKIDISDIISNILLFFLLDNCLLQRLNIDGSGIYENYKG